MLRHVKCFILLSDLLLYTTSVNSFGIVKNSLNIRSCKSKKDGQHNDQRKKEKRTTNDLLNTTQKTTDRPTPLRTRGELKCSGSVSSY